MIAEPECSKRKCLYFLGVFQKDGDEVTEVVYCTAFPEGIPDEIAYGDDKHKTVRKDQVGNYIYKKET